MFELQAGPAYAEAFLSVLRNVTKEDTVQYVLALLDNMLTGLCGKNTASYFQALEPCGKSGACVCRGLGVCKAIS